MYAIKFEFEIDNIDRTGTKILTYSDMMKAAGVFNMLSYSYAMAQPLRDSKGRSFDVLGVWKYEVDEKNHEDTVRAVSEGRALLIDEAPEVAFDLDEV
jgi:hypothetical protein